MYVDVAETIEPGPTGDVDMLCHQCFDVGDR